MYSCWRDIVRDMNRAEGGMEIRVTIELLDGRGDTMEKRDVLADHDEPGIHGDVESALDELIVVAENMEPEGPDDDDYTLTPTGPLGSRTAVGQFNTLLDTFDSDDEALAFVREHMKTERFYPNVWRMSDHGNWTQIYANTGEEVKIR